MQRFTLRPSVVVLALLVLVSLAGCKRTLKLEAKVTGFKPGTETLMMHVVSEKGASLQCDPPGYGCKRTDVGASKEVDIELETQSGQNEKKIYLKGQIGPATNTIIVDPAASMPPTVKVSLNKYVECIAKDCSGTITVVPAGHISLRAPAGTAVEIGTSKLTVGANGGLEANFDTVPALKDQPLSKLLNTKDPATFGSSAPTLTLPDKAKTSSKFDLTTEGAQNAIEALLKTSANGPVLFPWEKTPPAGKGRAVAMFCSSFCTIGGDTSAPLADLRVVALGVEKGTRKSTCSYTNKVTGKPATANLTSHDETVTAYDRATGKKLGVRAFAGSNTCSWEVTAKSGASLSDQDAYLDGSAVTAWAAALAR